jgi:hypothetical protein
VTGVGCETFDRNWEENKNAGKKNTTLIKCTQVHGRETKKLRLKHRNKQKSELCIY